MKQLAMYINGRFENDFNGEWRDVLNPSTEEAIAREPKGGKADVDRAVAAARAAQPAWERLPAVERGAYLRKIAQGIRERADELTDTIVAEGGKTKDLARVEVMFTADYLDYQAEWARRYEGEIIQSDRPRENILLFKRPLGVVAGILPWNFPFFLIARKMAPALLTGNTIVIKPSMETPINAFEFCKIVDEVGLPAGVFNMVGGSGRKIGEALTTHPDVGLISMTGSVDVGKRIMEQAGSTLTRVNLELGGKAPAIVLADADLDLAATAIWNSRVINTGQVCNCAEVVLVEESAHDDLLAKLVEKMESTQYGNPVDIRELDMGPLITPEAMDKLDEMIEAAVAAGCRVETGGARATDKGEGNFYQPTVLSGATADMAIAREEIFGPVLPVVKVKDLDEAIAIANESDYGLTSSIFTNNINAALKAARQLQYGETYINREHFEAMQGFHAGRRNSGIGGADGKHGLMEYVETHVTYIQTHD